MGAVPQRDADLLHLWTAYSRAGTPSEKAAALAALHAEVEKRDAVDSRIRASVWALLQQPAVLVQLQVLFILSCSEWYRWYDTQLQQSAFSAHETLQESVQAGHIACLVALSLYMLGY